MRTKTLVIRTKEQVQELIDEIKNTQTPIAVDTETTSLVPTTGKIIGVSVSTKIGQAWYIPTFRYNKETDELEELLIEGKPAKEYAKQIANSLKGKKLVTHNGSFDSRYIYYFLGVDIISSIWVDTILLTHTVQEEGAGFGVFGLKELAIHLGPEVMGYNVADAANKEQLELKESILANGGSTSKNNYELYKADMEVIAKYAGADTDMTLRLLVHFFKKLKEENLQEFFFEEVMPVYREVTIPMEMDGIKLDIPYMKQTLKEVQEEKRKVESAVIGLLKQYDAFDMWVRDRAAAKFPINNKGNFGKRLLQVRGYVDVPLRQKELKASIQDPQLLNFMLTGKYEPDMWEELQEVSKLLWIDFLEGVEISISSRHQMSDYVYEYLGEKPLSFTEKGAPQFDDKYLESIQTKYAWARQLQVYNKLCKIESTYIQGILDKSIDGRFHPYFKQHGTVSGRYSSNLQQLPKPMEPGDHEPVVVDYTNRLRAFFISDEGEVFIDCDYTSLEPHIFASVAEDENLRKVFEEGLDFYSYVAIRTKKIPNVSADKKADNYLDKVHPGERQGAKPYSLGMAYGMSPYALAQTINKPVKEAEELHRGYLEGFPGVARWIDSSRKFVKEHGYIKNIFGRIRHLPQVAELFRIFGDTLLDYNSRKEYGQSLGETEVSKMYLDYNNGMNALLNFQIQSVGASVVNRAALAINRALREKNIPGKVVAQIHDQLVTKTKDQYKEEVREIVQYVMENTTKLPGVTLKAPAEIALNLKEGH